MPIELIINECSIQTKEKVSSVDLFTIVTKNISQTVPTSQMKTFRRLRMQYLNAQKQEKVLKDNEVGGTSHHHYNTQTFGDQTPDMRVIRCLWVFRFKEEPFDLRFMSRLYARGD